jgi:hypothetical protein
MDLFATGTGWHPNSSIKLGGKEILSFNRNIWSVIE